MSAVKLYCYSFIKLFKVASKTVTNTQKAASFFTSGSFTVGFTAGLIRYNCHNSQYTWPRSTPCKQAWIEMFSLVGQKHLFYTVDSLQVNNEYEVAKLLLTHCQTQFQIVLLRNHHNEEPLLDVLLMLIKIVQLLLYAVYSQAEL